MRNAAELRNAPGLKKRIYRIAKRLRRRFVRRMKYEAQRFVPSALWFSGIILVAWIYSVSHLLWVYWLDIALLISCFILGAIRYVLVVSYSFQVYLRFCRLVHKKHQHRVDCRT